MKEEEPSKYPERAPSEPRTPTTGNGQEADGQEIESVAFYRRKRFVVPVLVLLTLLVIAGVYWYLSSRTTVSTDDAYIDGNRVTISSYILGRLVEVRVDEGDTVRKGEVVVRLDDTDLKAQQQQAIASLDLANGNRDLAAVAFARARDDFQRAAVQLNGRAISQEQYEHAQRELESARVRQSIAQAQVAAAQAQLGVIQANLAHTTIVAPFDGVVSKRWAMQGDVVQPAQPILSVYDLSNLWVTANIEETKLTPLREGQSVTINVDAFPDVNFTGKLLQLGANTASQFSLIPPNNAAGNFTKVTQRVPLKISIDGVPPKEAGSQARLVPGMSVEVDIHVR